MNSIGITGSSGFIGKHLYGKLCHTYRIYCFDTTLLKRLDVTNQISVTAMVNKVSGIVHLASISRVKIANLEPYSSIVTNVLGTLNILEAIRLSKHKPFLIYASSIAAKRCDSVYGISKYMCELLCYIYSKEYRLDIKIIRIPDVYGKGMNRDKAIPTIIRAIRHRKRVILNKPKQVFNLVHYSNVVDIIADQVITLEKLAKKIKEGTNYETPNRSI